MRSGDHRGSRSLLRTGLLLAGLLTASQATGQTLAALPPAGPLPVASGEAKPIPAWVEFCRRSAAECAVDPSEPETITLSPRVWQTILTVNRGVNGRIRPITDQEHWGVPDRWDLAEDGTGDCEDFQLLKRKLLAEGGLPRRAMRMTVVIDEKGEGHAVLMLRTDRGDLVLDNKTSAVLPWHRTGYTFIKRESQSAVAWVSLGGATGPTMTANR
ncbi:transglutaminase-like cysteine peptidase [Methylobacterium sp. WSM2598]|uniref:transglutaminase-like cysteine peptidase n=1 Tax=Methylobacterium sp. WSM2598 TaxID=398261 RepID=UPI00036041CF|nr:transglutaminase-like cysteine peptidase [Methylobacterium sp. WSM2598]